MKTKQRVSFKNRVMGLVRGPVRGLGVLCLVAVGGAALTSCGEGEGSYYPLDAGRTWEYELNVEYKKGVNRGTFRVMTENLPAIEVDSQVIIPRITENRGTLYYREDEDGVRRVIFPNLGKDVEAKIVDERIVLKNSLEVGETWNEPSRTYISIWEHPGLHKRIVVKVPVTMNYVIEAVDDTVSVPAGTFYDCLRLRAIGRTVFEADERLGEIPVEVESTEWYAPGVGLIRSQRSEQSKVQVFGSNSSLLELVDYSGG